MRPVAPELQELPEEQPEDDDPIVPWYYLVTDHPKSPLINLSESTTLKEIKELNCHLFGSPSFPSSCDADGIDTDESELLSPASNSGSASKSDFSAALDHCVSTLKDNHKNQPSSSSDNKDWVKLIPSVVLISAALVANGRTNGGSVIANGNNNIPPPDLNVDDLMHVPASLFADQQQYLSEKFRGIMVNQQAEIRRLIALLAAMFSKFLLKFKSNGASSAAATVVHQKNDEVVDLIVSSLANLFENLGEMDTSTLNDYIMYPPMQ